MSTWFASPHLVDLVLVFTALEAVALMARAARHGRRRREVVLLLLPGICLMLAVRAALAGAAWPWLPVALAGAFVAHVADLRQRWSSPRVIQCNTNLA